MILITQTALIVDVQWIFTATMKQVTLFMERVIGNATGVVLGLLKMIYNWL